MRDDLATANNELAKLKNNSDYNSFQSFNKYDKPQYISDYDDSYSGYLNAHKLWVAAILAGFILALVGFYFPEAFNIFKGDAPDAGDAGGAGGVVTEATAPLVEAKHGSWFTRVSHNPGSVFSKNIDMGGATDTAVEIPVAIPVAEVTSAEISA